MSASEAEVTVARVDASVVAALRARVLRVGSGLTTLRYDQDDDPRTASLAATIAQQPCSAAVGTATVFPAPCPWRPDEEDAWRLRAMATDDRFTGRGVGAAVLRAAVAHVAAEGGRVIWCDARAVARSFYERHGFTAEGEGYEMDGIGAHWPMARVLSPS